MSYTPESISQLQARLNRLSPQQLKQFAATNYDDPISLALAMQVDSERKKMTAQGQAMAAGQQKPPVAAQAIQSIGTELPENTGIAQLPAPNIQSMADGGIAGYDMEPVVRMAGGGTPIGRWWEGVTQDWGKRNEEATLRNRLAAQFAPAGGLQGLFKEQTDEERAAAQKVLSILPKLSMEQMLLLKEQGVAALPTLETALAPPPKTTTPAPASAAASTAPEPIAEVPPPDIKTPPPSPPPRPRAPVAPANSGIAALPLTPEALMTDRAAISAAQNLEVPIELQTAMDTQAREEKKAAEERLNTFDIDTARRGVAFADREARLKAREAEFGQQKEDNKSMALLEAGLAIMSGASPYALQNIGAGALVGTKAYKSGLKDLAEVRDKLDDAFGRIEEYRRTEDTMTSKERRTLQADIDKTVTEANNKGIAALTKKWDMGEQQANAVMQQLGENRKTVIEQGEATKRTAMTVAGQAAATKANSPMALLEALGGGDLEKGLRKKAEIEAGKFDVRKAYSDYLIGMSKIEGSSANLMDFATFATQFAPVVTPNKDSVVRTRPGS
jgi:hypothetical protein